jgi:hypothetical protein
MLMPILMLYAYFIGWLVHSVLNPGEPSFDPVESGYRVSLSLNLKGEWQDTASLHYRDNCTP